MKYSGCLHQENIINNHKKIDSKIAVGFDNA